jgi:hypothetical protein
MDVGEGPEKTTTAYGPALSMLAVPLFWGGTYLLTDLSMQSAGESSITPGIMALYVVFIRCAAAAVVLGLHSPLGIAKRFRPGAHGCHDRASSVWRDTPADIRD